MCSGVGWRLVKKKGTNISKYKKKLSIQFNTIIHCMDIERVFHMPSPT